MTLCNCYFWKIAKTHRFLSPSYNFATKLLFAFNVDGKPQSTYIYRAPQWMSPRWNWDSPTPLAASECALPPYQRVGGAHSPAAKGVGEPQFQRLEKRLELCLLCVVSYPCALSFKHQLPHPRVRTGRLRNICIRRGRHGLSKQPFVHNNLEIISDM